MQFSSTYRNSYDQQRNDYSLSLNNNTSQSIFNLQEFIKKKTSTFQQNMEPTKKLSFK